MITHTTTSIPVTPPTPKRAPQRPLHKRLPGTHTRSADERRDLVRDLVLAALGVVHELENLSRGRLRRAAGGPVRQVLAGGLLSTRRNFGLPEKSEINTTNFTYM